MILGVNTIHTSIGSVENTLGVVVMAYMTVVLRVVGHRQKTARLVSPTRVGINNFHSSNSYCTLASELTVRHQTSSKDEESLMLETDSSHSAQLTPDNEEKLKPSPPKAGLARRSVTAKHNSPRWSRRRGSWSKGSQPRHWGYNECK
jgi:hypothetical protein